MRSHRFLDAIAIAAALAGATPAWSQTVVAGPTSTDLQAAVGESITIPIAADLTGAGGITLGAYRASFAWDKTKFQLVSTASGSFGAAVFNTAPATDSGLVRFAAVNAGGAGGVPVLGSVTLQVLNSDSSKAFTTQFQELTAALTYQNLLPFLTLTTGRFCGSLVFGDLDGNGPVQALDAQIVLMHSVGTAVADISRGDVDGNGKVEPRDALIILSSVVGLDVSSFRVSRLITACAPGTPNTVIVQPTPVTLTAGDNFNLAATVRTAGGALLGSRSLAWGSDATGVVQVDGAGKLTAVAPGTANVTAAVAPGVTGTATVNVAVSTRHRWVVNPLLAQGKPGELGTDAFPFSTIAQALTRAADGDTVAIGIAPYHESLTTTKRLVFLGDSTAAGMPTISVPGGSIGALTATGLLVMKRLRFTESLRGLVIQADSAALKSLVFEGIRSRPVVIHSPMRAVLDGISISGTTSAGILVDGAGVVHVLGSRVTTVEHGQGVLLSPEGDSLRAVGIYAQADTFTVEFSSVSQVNGPGILGLKTKRMLVRQSSVTETSGGSDGSEDGQVPAIAADTTVTLDVDTVIVRRSGTAVWAAGDTVRVVKALFEDLDGSGVELEGRVAAQPYHLLQLTDVVVNRAWAGVDASLGKYAKVVRSSFRQLQAGGLFPSADSMVVDSVTMEDIHNDAAIYAYGSQQLKIDSTVIRRTDYQGVSAQNVRSVWINRTVVDSANLTFVRQGGCQYECPPPPQQHAIQAGGGDTVVVQDVTVRYGYASGMTLEANDSVALHGSRVLQNADDGAWLSGTAVIVADTNLIADNGRIGLKLFSPGTGSYNSIRRNADFGLTDLSAGGSVFQHNNFEGNGGGVNNNGTTLDASNSWWGDALGPRCGTGASGCDGAATGDYIYGDVSFAPPAATVIADAPVGAPPAPVSRQITATSPSIQTSTAARAPLVRRGLLGKRVGRRQEGAR